MKKVLALALALVLSFSCMAVAFAAETTLKCPWCGAQIKGSSEEEAADLLNAHMATKDCITTAAPTEAASFPCAYCGKLFYTETAYHDHLATCPNYTFPSYDTGVVLPVSVFDMSVSELFAYMLDVGNLNNDSVSILMPIIESIVTFVQDLINGLINGEDAAAGVEGVNSDLNCIEEKLASFGIDTGKGKICEILNCIKSKIKALYCGEPATTAAEEAPQTGSASTGIAVFAAISVAAAAAYVCTKKRA